MTLRVIQGFAAVHIIIGLVTAAYVHLSGGDGAAPGMGILEATPLESLTGDSSILSKAGGFSFFRLFDMLFALISALWGLFWFNYAILDGDGLAGLVGTVLRVAGMSVLAHLVLQIMVGIVRR